MPWLMLLAAGHGLSVVDFLKRIDAPKFESIGDLGWRAQGALECAEICAAGTGIPLRQIRTTMIGALAGILRGEFEPGEPRRYAVWDPWITQFTKGPATHYVGEFCPLCLLEGLPFRLSWRISLFVSCPRHGCLLCHLCGNCGERFNGVNHLAKVDLSQNPNLLARCSRCSGHLAIGNPITPVASDVQRLEHVHRSMVRNPLCASYFPVLHSVLRIMARNPGYDNPMSRGFREKIARAPWEWEEQPPRFEQCEPIQRQYLLQALLDLFREWPTAWVDILQRNKISFFTIPNPPEWMELALMLTTKRPQFNINYVRAQFWKAAEKEGWTQAAELLNGAPRHDSAQKRPPRSEWAPAAPVRHHVAYSD